MLDEPAPTWPTVGEDDLRGFVTAFPGSGTTDADAYAAVDRDRVIADAQVPVLVDFYADWCGPCKMVAPIMDELARSRLGSVLVAKLDTDRNQQTAQRFQISSIPTVMVFKDGKVAAKQVGALPRPGYEALIDRAMA